MKKSKRIDWAFLYAITSFYFIFLLTGRLNAQDRSISVYQYRRVPAEKMEEFIKRETTHWSKLAQKGVDNKLMSFWAVLEKIGGHDLPNSSNFLIIYTYPDIDKAGTVWDNAESVAGVKIADMEISSLSAVISQYFVKQHEWVQAADAVPGKDFNYAELTYQNTDYADSLVDLEKKYWKPYIKAAMEKGITPERAWGNAVILSPRGPDIKATTVSIDLYRTLSDVIFSSYDTTDPLPIKLFPLLAQIQMNRPAVSIYRVVKIVSAP